jgi:hypothetical protein
MQTPQIKTCSDCQQLTDLLKKLDLKLWEIAKKDWDQKKYNLDKTPTPDVQELLIYKRILQNRIYNADYPCSDFSSQDMFKRLISKIASFSFKCLCFRQPPAVSTTTTTSTTNTTSSTTTTTTTAATPLFAGASDSSSTPDESAILSGNIFYQNPVNPIIVNWTSFNSAPKYLWFAVPDVTGADKSTWYVDVLNNGNIGTSEDLFGASSVVNVDGTNYLVYITNYPTQFFANVLIS